MNICRVTKLPCCECAPCCGSKLIKDKSVIKYSRKDIGKLIVDDLNRKGYLIGEVDFIVDIETYSLPVFDSAEAKVLDTTQWNKA